MFYSLYCAAFYFLPPMCFPRIWWRIRRSFLLSILPPARGEEALLPPFLFSRSPSPVRRPSVRRPPDQTDRRPYPPPPAIGALRAPPGGHFSARVYFWGTHDKVSRK